MTVQELIAELSGCDLDLQVILAKDAEGNEFSPLSGWGDGHYVPRSSCYGEVKDDEDLAANAVILWPTN